MHIKTEQVERHTLAVIVDNEPGILARIAGLFTARGYNIESLTVSEITADKAVSRITIVTSASPPVMEQIIAQLDRLVPVHKVTDLTVLGDHVERELALVKVAGTGDRRIEALRLAEVYRARVVDATIGSFVFEVTGTIAKIDKFVNRHVTAKAFKKRYADVFTGDKFWRGIKTKPSLTYGWDDNSTYVKLPPYFKDMPAEAPDSFQTIGGARILALLGDSVTTDHISPAGSFREDSDRKSVV